MTVSAAPLLLGLTIVAVGAVGVLLMSFFSYQRSLLRYRCWAVRDDVVDAISAGRIEDSAAARDIIRLAESAIHGAEILTPVKILSLVMSYRRVVSSAQASAPSTAPKADRHLLALHRRRLVTAWVKVVLLGSPSGLVVAAVVGAWAVLRAPTGRRRKKVMREAVYEHLVQPVDAAAITEELTYSRRRPQLV